MNKIIQFKKDDFGTKRVYETKIDKGHKEIEYKISKNGVKFVVLQSTSIMTNAMRVRVLREDMAIMPYWGDMEIEQTELELTDAVVDAVNEIIVNFVGRFLEKEKL